MGTKNETRSGFKVPPLSTAIIRDFADRVRGALGLGPDRFDPLQLIDRLAVDHGIVVEIAEPGMLPRGAEGSCDPAARTIYLSETAFKQIEDGHPRGLFTFMHELGHQLLCHQRLPLRDDSYNHQRFEDSEWQANTFAAELLMPVSTILSLGLCDSESIAEHFGVSRISAEYRLESMKKQGLIK